MPLIVRVWSPGAVEPHPKRELEEPLALDRDALGVTDTSVSRAENAPVVVPLGEQGFELQLPERSAHELLVLDATGFEQLQQGVPPHTQPWKIAPAQLALPGAVCAVDDCSLALLRPLDPEATLHHLMLLPALRVVRRGAVLKQTARCVVVVGPAAVAITPAVTAVPPVERAGRFGVLASLTLPPPLEQPPFGVTGSGLLAAGQLTPQQVSALDDFAAQPHNTPPLAAWLPGAPLSPRGAAQRSPNLAPLELNAPFLYQELPLPCSELLAAMHRRSALIPVFDGPRTPRLAFIYTRPDASVGVLISGDNLSEWVSELGELLSHRPLAAVSAAPAARTRPELPQHPLARFGHVETRNRRFAKLLERAAVIGPSNIDVMILGPSGTGKEHLAQAMHASSVRAKGPFVAFNCTAVRENFIESELFGHVRGAFTGAHTDRKGAFVAARGGTLFLDEVGDASLSLQLSLLRALETRRVKPLGADREVTVDVRVISATSRDVDSLRASEQFRDDLYFRLAQSVISLPSLDQRIEDLPALCAGFLEAHPDVNWRPPAPLETILSDEALTKLEAAAWPGNVRQLRSALNEAVALSRGTRLSPQHFESLGRDQVYKLPELPPVRFDAHGIIELASRIWYEQSLVPLPEHSEYKQRALWRAALLYLDHLQSREHWPPSSKRLWSARFPKNWHRSEKGRGLTDVVKLLAAGDEEKAREWVLGRVG